MINPSLRRVRPVLSLLQSTLSSKGFWVEMSLKGGLGEKCGASYSRWFAQSPYLWPLASGL